MTQTKSIKRFLLGRSTNRRIFFHPKFRQKNSRRDLIKGCVCWWDNKHQNTEIFTFKQFKSGWSFCDLNFYFPFKSFRHAFKPEIRVVPFVLLHHRVKTLKALSVLSLAFPSATPKRNETPEIWLAHKYFFFVFRQCVNKCVPIRTVNY